MKTKYLIAMLAAPMFFAACSQEDLIDSVPGTEKIEGTPYGNELVFNVGDRNDASTRITTDGQWSTGDQIGMAWISDGVADANGDYQVGKLVTGTFGNLTNVIGNVPLNFVSGTSFKSNTMMFVGTYLAYYPFNEGLKEVGELKLSVGANQTSKDLEDAYNKMIFASDTLSLQAENAGTGKTPVIGMKRLSNMLALEIYLKDNSTTMTAPVIQKVELDLQSSSAGTHLLATSGTVVPGKWIVDNTNEEGKNYFKDIKTSDSYLTPADQGEITVTTTEDLAVSKDNGATVYLSFMPSDLSSLDVTNSVLKIYTNYGVIKSSVVNAIKFYNLKDNKYEAATNIQAAFTSCDKVAGRLIKKKVEIDLSKVDVNGLTATNTAEVRSIINNWKLKGSDAGDITINVTHDADYLKDFNQNEISGKTCKNIKLEGLDLSDIPGKLTIQAKDTLEFEGATNLNAVNKEILIKKEGGSGEQAVIFNGETSIGTLKANSLIAFNGNTTIYGTLTQVPTVAKDEITVAAGKTLTVNGGGLTSNTPTYSKLVNSGTISLINSGAINKGASSQNLIITNYAAIEGLTPTAYNEGTINIGDADSEGNLAGTDASSFDNKHGTVRFFNGEYVAPGEGTVLAVAQNALQFSAAVDKKVTTIEVIGNIDFSKIDLDEAKGKATTVVMKSGSKLSMGTKAITLGNVKVAENATIEGKKLIVFKGKLEVMPNATLTVGDETTIHANILDLPRNAKIEGNAETSVVVYKTAGLLGGTYTANISHDSELEGVKEN